MKAGVLVVSLQRSRAGLLVHLDSQKPAFMPPPRLGRQFATLEEPGPDEPAITVRVQDKIGSTVAAMIRALQLLARLLLLMPNNFGMTFCHTPMRPS